jgi:hypothetical protein
VKITRLLDTKKVSETAPTGKSSPEISLVEEKVRELIDVIGHSVVDSEQAGVYQERIDEAFRASAFKAKQVAPFQELDKDNNLSREELLEGLEKLLAENQIDSRISNSQVPRNAFQKAVNFVLAILLIVFGFAMIIMPAPPSFEIFTVFYFNANDGVTIMDLVSLLIIFGGVLLFVLNFNKK